MLARATEISRRDDQLRPRPTRTCALSGRQHGPHERFAKLEQWARGKLQDLSDLTHRGSGQVLDTIDHAGFIGKSPGSKYVYVATGESRQARRHGRC